MQAWLVVVDIMHTNTRVEHHMLQQAQPNDLMHCTEINTESSQTDIGCPVLILLANNGRKTLYVY